MSDMWTIYTVKFPIMYFYPYSRTCSGPNILPVTSPPPQMSYPQPILYLFVWAREIQWLINFVITYTPIPLAVLSKVQICNRLIAGSVVSNPAESMGVRLLCLLCDVYVATSEISWSPFHMSPYWFCTCSIQKPPKRWPRPNLACSVTGKKIWSDNVPYSVLTH
jgi:hypothetical protein